jgi:RNA polymerase sigma-70 factor (ECF subfamily)
VNRSLLDSEVADLLSAGDVSAATTLTLRAYGAELLGFLRGTLRPPHDPEDAFSVLSATVWRSLPSFEWRCSLRTWLYVLARRTVVRFVRGARRVELPLSQVSEISRLVAEIRATSLPTIAPIRDRFTELRAQLDPDDQMLLVLRVDREMPWRDIAEVLADEGADVDRLAASLRKRFERVKVRIRSLARDAGLAD